MVLKNKRQNPLKGKTLEGHNIVTEKIKEVKRKEFRYIRDRNKAYSSQTYLL